MLKSIEMHLLLIKMISVCVPSAVTLDWICHPFIQKSLVPGFLLQHAHENWAHFICFTKDSLWHRLERSAHTIYPPPPLYKWLSQGDALSF